MSKSKKSLYSEHALILYGTTHVVVLLSMKSEKFVRLRAIIPLNTVQYSSVKKK
jgi:hypothetical protein